MNFLLPFLNPMTWPALGLAVVLAFGAGWWRGDAHGDAQCEAASLKAEIERLELEAKLKAEADEQESIDTAILLAEKERKEKEDEALIQELRNRPNKCLLGKDAGRI